MSSLVKILGVIVLAAVGLQGAGRQSQSVSDTGRVQGRVFAAGTGLPIPDATVRLAGRQISRATPTDDDGYFDIEDVPPGDYLITAVMYGYAVGAFGQRTPSDIPRSFQLRARETSSQADIQLTALGKLSGQITDGTGRPASAVKVSVVRRPGIGAVDRPPNGGTVAGGTTDEKGIYSITGLPAGNYYVMVTQRPPEAPTLGRTPRPAMLEVPTRTLYPGTGVPAEAWTVRVELGSEVTDINFALQPARFVRIAGVVLDTLGQPVKDGLVMLNPVPTEISNVTAGLLFSEVGDDGKFLLRDVPPGLYRLDVRGKSGFEAIATSGGGDTRQMIRAASSEFASQPLRVEGDDIEDLMVRTQPGFTISGNLVLEGLTTQGVKAIEISATSIAEASMFSRLLIGDSTIAQADGSFQLRKLLGPQVIRVSGLPAGWALKRVTVGGLNVTDEGIDVTHDWSGVDVLIARETEIAGRVTDRRGLLIPGATVIVFAQDRQRWMAPLTRFVKTTLSNDRGAFLIAGLPVGRYYGVALPAVIEGKLTDPDDLEMLIPRATRFSLGESERRSFDLRLE